MARFDLTDFEWSVIEPLLPNKPHGVPRVVRVAPATRSQTGGQSMGSPFLRDEFSSGSPSTLATLDAN